MVLTLKPDALALLGPTHVSGFTELQYVKMYRVGPANVFVKVVGPDSEDTAEEIEVKKSIVSNRLVEIEESDLWPATFVGHPLAFVRSSGVEADQWAYGLVSGYHMQNAEAFLHVQDGDQRLEIKLTDPPAVIKVDQLNYVLQTGATTNATTMNPFELLERQDEVIVTCDKIRGSNLPSTIMSSLSVPFRPEKITSVIFPTTLRVYPVSRQHVIECVLEWNGLKPDDVYKFTPAANPAILGNKNEKKRAKTTSVAAFSESEDDADSESDMDGDVQELLRQNMPLTKRVRLDDTTEEQSTERSSSAVSRRGDEPDTRKEAVYKPSSFERDINKVIVRPDLIGMNPQCLLESVQQASQTLFLATPPILRGLYDFSFGLRGLSIMHFSPLTSTSRMEAMESNPNMTDFARSNKLHPSPAPNDIQAIISALKCLAVFAKSFFNISTRALIDSATSFMEDVVGFSQPDSATCKLLMHWINTKFGKFRSLLATNGLQAALCIKDEFVNNDSELTGIYRQRHEARLNEALNLRSHNQIQPHGSREYKAPSRSNSIPPSILDKLPKLGSKSICMKYLSNSGCYGGAPGKCFSSKRAHFQPTAIPEEVKAYINANYQGLSPKYSQL